jgi:hypothetical protein
MRHPTAPEHYGHIIFVIIAKVARLIRSAIRSVRESASRGHTISSLDEKAVHTVRLESLLKYSLQSAKYEFASSNTYSIASIVAMDIL